WDEMLTDDQMDVICGVYKTERVTIEAEHVSWFPKDASWRGSSLNGGFWSSDAQSWYQRRVAKCLGGQFKCGNQTEWK
ncbi:hypothetical protein ARMSODRAFT_851513, partial [Armillaria solidipes]